MIFAFFNRILDEEHLVDEAHEALAQASIFVVLFLSCEIVGDSALGCKIVLELVAAIAYVIHEPVAGLVGIFAEEIAEEMVHDVGSRLQVHIKPEVVVVAQLVGSEGQGRVKDAEQAVDCIVRNLPYAEESKHVVDSVGIEILAHFAEAVFPPFETVTAHFLPIICGEAPVLAKHREIIRRCTGLTVHVKQTGIGPSVNAVARDTDGNVALDGDTVGIGILMNMLHLLVKVILQIAYIVYFIAVGSDEAVNLRLVILGIFTPLGKHWSMELVAEHAESGIRHQP